MDRAYKSLFSVVLFLTVISSAVMNERAEATRSCAAGGVCKMGDTGPGGGFVFYVSSAQRWWGRYLEARVLVRAGLPWSKVPATPLYVDDADGTARRKRIDAKAIGMGATNTAAIVAQGGKGLYAASYVDRVVIGGKTDWFLPSKDELNALYNQHALTGRPAVPDGPYLTSSEAGANVAWYQLFQDGTQFTDENLVGATTGNKTLPGSIMHSGSGFPHLLFRMVAVRAFPADSGLEPPTSQPALTGKTCGINGPCRVGDIGPAGGVVFYVAAKRQTWGRYLEVAPLASEGIGLPWKKLSVNDRRNPVYRDKGGVSARNQRIISKFIGMGRINTTAIIAAYGKGSYAAWYADKLIVNGFDDWFLPSADEVYVMFNVLRTAEPVMADLGLYYFWTSSEYDYNNAWTHTFKSGQQFDREKFLRARSAVADLTAIRVRAIRAF